MKKISYISKSIRENKAILASIAMSLALVASGFFFSRVSAQTTYIDPNNVDPTAGVKWSGGSCASQQAQLQQMNDAMTQLQDSYSSLKQKVSNIHDMIGNYQANGVGPFALRISPVSPSAGSSFSLSATVQDASVTTYNVDVVLDNNLIAHVAASVPVGISGRPANIQQDFKLPSSLVSGNWYGLRMYDVNNKNNQSTLYFQVQ